jgi:hypothetical protein
METYLFCDGCLFEVLTHHPRQPPNTVSPIGLFAVKKPNVWVLCLEVFPEAYGHTIGQRHHPVFFVFALTDMNGLSLKIDVGYLQVNDLLSA